MKKTLSSRRFGIKARMIAWLVISCMMLTIGMAAALDYEDPDDNGTGQIDEDDTTGSVVSLTIDGDSPGVEEDEGEPANNAGTGTDKGDSEPAKSADTGAEEGKGETGTTGITPLLLDLGDIGGLGGGITPTGPAAAGPDNDCNHECDEDCENPCEHSCDESCSLFGGGFMGIMPLDAPTPGVDAPLDFVANPSTRSDIPNGWDWDEDTKTLTLNGLIMNVDVTDPAIKLPGGATVEIKGTNSINNDSGDGIGFYGGDDDGDSTINAAGAVLNINSKGTAIYTDETDNMHLVINGGTFGLTAGGEACGIASHDTLDINNAFITISGGIESILSWGDVNITGGELSISDSLDGIVAEGDVNITNGDVTITDAWGITAGLYGSKGDINITDSKVYLEGYVGMTTDYNVTMTGGKIDIITDRGIEVHGNITITGTELTIKTEDEDNESIIANSGTVTINSGKIDITAKAIAGISGDSIKINGGSGTISGAGYAATAKSDETLSVAPTVTVWDPETEILAIIIDGLIDYGSEGSFPAQYFVDPGGDPLKTVQFDSFTVKVTGGTGGGDYKATTTVTLTANDPAGQRFKDWTIPGVTSFTSGSLTSRVLSFVMPFANVDATANFVDLYTVTVTGGNIMGPDGSTSIGTTSTFAQGDEVHIKAGAPPAGQRFKEWTITPAVTFVPNHGSLTMPDSEFYMPAANVTVVAVFENIPIGEFLITVNHEGKGVANANVQSAAPGVTVTITAVPDAGNVFVRWDVISGEVDILIPTAATATFIMGNTNVEINAVFAAAGSPGTGDYRTMVLPIIMITLGSFGLGSWVYCNRRLLFSRSA